MEWFLLKAAVYFIEYIIIATIVNIVLMGALRFRFSLNCKVKQFVITKENRIDFQNGNECAAFSSAYVLRHWGIEESGNNLYEKIQNKTKDGCVYPKGIQRLLSQYGFRVNYCAGTLNSLKNEVGKGNPVIVMIRSYAGRNLLHFVPVVGYDEQHIFIAESWKEFENCEEKRYNRVLTNEEFKKLWNTGMWKMPLYRNTYLTVYRQVK